MSIGLDSRGGFFLLDDLLDIQVQAPCEIVPGFRIARANDLQVDVIRRALQEFGSSNALLNRTAWYENDPVPLVPRGHTHLPLPRERWRYTVVEFDAGKLDHSACLFIFRAIYLTPIAVTSGLHFITTEPFGFGKIVSMGWQESAIVSDAPPPTQIKTLDSALLDSWRSAIAALERLDKAAYEGILRAAEFFERFGRFRMPYGLELLGLFMVIEMLLTHAPGDKEVGDSLSHQLSAKIPLLELRMSEPIDYGIFNTHLAHEKIWKRLYEYRSLIAHGAHADLTHARIEFLKDYSTVLQFLRRATRKLLRFAVDDPQLVTSLKRV